jgi:hypothetical protein
MKTREEMINALSLAVDKYSGDKEVRNHIQEVYVQKRLPIMTVGMIFKEEKTVNSLFEIEQGIWCVALYEITKDSTIEPSQFFTDGEIYEIKEYQNKDILELGVDEILLHNVEVRTIKGKLYFFCPFASYYQILLFSKNSLITYNFETQRDAKLTKYKGRITRQENVNLQSVDDIAGLVEVDEMPPSMITLNIRKTKNSSKATLYDDKTKDLRIKVSYIDEVFADLPDGYHRTLGIVKGTIRANAKNVHLDGGVMLLVTNHTPEESQRYIAVQNKQNAIKAEHIKAFEKDEFNEFAKMINTEGSKTKNVMYDRLCNTLEEVEIYEDKYTTINILHDAFKLSGLKLGKPYNNENIYLPHFIYIFNTVIGYYMNKYDDNIEKIKKETILLEPNTFVAWVAIGTELLEKENKKEILMDLLQNKMNIERNTYNWELLEMYKKNPKSYKKIYDYFENIVKEVE